MISNDTIAFHILPKIPKNGEETYAKDDIEDKAAQAESQENSSFLADDHRKTLKTESERTITLRINNHRSSDMKLNVI